LTEEKKGKEEDRYNTVVQTQGKGEEEKEITTKEMNHTP